MTRKEPERNKNILQPTHTYYSRIMEQLALKEKKEKKKNGFPGNISVLRWRVF
ncbi:MAG: hypothetical protein GY696_38710 [Gammaproteobacteria bacterium]|nr:hypothetical protein [Gammaproteobacteria bacterium]